MMKLAKLIVALILPVILAGCERRDRLVWSPDGQHLAVVASDGLRLGDVTGALSTALPGLENVDVVRWLPDSTNALIVSSDPTSSWKEASRLLSAKERAKAIADAEWLWTFPGDVATPPNSKNRDFSADSFLYLHYKYGSKAVKAMLARRHLESFDASVTIHTLQLVKLSHGQVERDRVLLRTTKPIGDVRLGAQGKLVAITEEIGKGYQLEVMPVHSGAMRVVAERVNRDPDWSLDGRSIIYAQTGDSTEHNGDYTLALASLLRQDLADYDGKLFAKFDAPKRLAQIPYSGNTRIRSMPDGDTIFNAEVIEIPCTVDKFDTVRSLYRLSRDGKTLAPIVASGDALGDYLDKFEVNQDGKQAAVPGSHGEVTVIELATGKVKSLEPKATDLLFSPNWRTANELCYPARNAHKVAGGHDVDAVLQSISDGKIQVLSTSWPQSASDFLNDPKKQDNTVAPTH